MKGKVIEVTPEDLVVASSIEAEEADMKDIRAWRHDEIGQPAFPTNFQIAKYDFFQVAFFSYYMYSS